MKRILVIRGGAIGDFILTLPAIKLLRESFPAARLEILGYQHIVALAEERFYADAARSIEYAGLAGFFARGGELDADLVSYFGSFDLIVSYLFDPDGIFEENVKRARAERFLAISPKIGSSEHASRQLARPLEAIGLKLGDSSSLLFPSAADGAAAETIAGDGETILALHPGSGGERKNWPLQNWFALGDRVLEDLPVGGRMLIVGGEADVARTTALRAHWSNPAIIFAEGMPLPHLAAVLARSFFIGHDSGISHLAAAAGAKCLLLFGPTDPDIWAPTNPGVTVLRAPCGNLDQLTVATVTAALERAKS